MRRSFSRLTRPNIRKLTTGEKLTENGITYERLTNGDGVYTVNIMVDGQRIHRVVGRESDGTTRTQAEEFILKVKQDAKQGRLNLPKGRKLAIGMTQAIKQYIDKLTLEGGKDLVAKKRRLTMHVSPFLKDTPLANISTFDIERYKKHRREQGVKAGTINRELAALSHLFTKAEEWGWIEKRPAKINRLKEDQGRIVYLTTEQAARLREHAQYDQSPHIYPFVMIGLETSMRSVEILSMRREHVHLGQRTIYIPQAKAGARAQPITNRLAAFLEEHLASLPIGTDWLFPSLASPKGYLQRIDKPFRRVVVAAGLEPTQITPHVMRHTAITHLVQVGVDLPTVKRISGHKTLAMVERYAHQNGEHIQIAMDKLEQRYAGSAV